ncbi:MAG: DNA primase [Alphaproteobacteria bacterium]|nr:DNA primase [Alphaproteobacteria bacterium]
MRFSPNLLDEILRRTDLVQLVGRRVKLIRKGRVMWGCCPFHKEKSPSFKVENERRTYHCFGCGAGGDAFKWLSETEGLTFPEAVERLAGEAGVELPKWTPEDEAREERKKSLYEIIEAACAFFEEQLRGRSGEDGRNYLKSRGLDDAAAKQFRLGYAPSHDALKEHLTKKNIALDDMVAAGLVRPQDGERSPRDFFFNRLMFPITDPRGRVIAFGGRALDPDAKPKYINTGETALFSKGRLLYNFATARPAAIKSGTIILAEGYMDVIALVRAGFDHAVAPLGTALTEEQLHLLWRTAAEPILAFDGDEAGLRAAQRAARLALPHLKPGYSLRFAFLPPGDDPDSLIRGGGPAAMKTFLDAAEPLAKVLWRVETEGKDFSTPERRAGLERALAEVVSAISDPKIADYYRRDFDQQVFERFKRRAPPARPERREYGTREPRRVPFPIRPLETVSPAVKNSLLARAGNSGARRRKETELAELLLEWPQIAVAHGEELAALPLSDRSLDRLRHELLNLAASGSRLEKPALENHLIRAGLGELLDRLGRRPPEGRGENAGGGPTEAVRGSAEVDMEARWLLAAAQLHELVEAVPERRRAMERFNSEASEESWREAHRLLQPRVLPNE